MKSRAVDRREDLLRTAARLFRERGYAATSVRDIADELGVTSAALYNYVASKEDLLYAILDHAMSIAERHLEQAHAPRAPLDQQLRSLIFHHVLAVLDEDQTAMAVFFQETGLRRGSRWREIDQRRVRYQEAIVRVFQQAADVGLIQTPDARVSAYGVLGMCNWLHRWYRPDGPLTREQIAQHFTDMVLHGLVRSKPESGPGLVSDAIVPYTAYRDP
jgi:AcrR family transcriptional regulator